MLWDVFISHAGEDKEEVARPLTHHLEDLGLRVWFDEMQLEIGDSLRAKIDEGLSQSRFGVVIISPHFFQKSWTQDELAGLYARRSQDRGIILPVWHNISYKEVKKHSPMLADLKAKYTSDGIDEVARAIAKKKHRPTRL